MKQFDWLELCRETTESFCGQIEVYKSAFGAAHARMNITDRGAVVVIRPTGNFGITTIFEYRHKQADDPNANIFTYTLTDDTVEMVADVLAGCAEVKE